MADGEGDAEVVGYGKPPIRTRFVKGRSGNPKGRPKGLKSPEKIFLSIVHERIRVTEQGKTRKTTKLDGILRRLVSEALGGNLRAIREVMFLTERLSANLVPEDHDAPDAENSRTVLALLVERLRQQTDEGR